VEHEGVRGAEPVEEGVDHLVGEQIVGVLPGGGERDAEESALAAQALRRRDDLVEDAVTPAGVRAAFIPSMESPGLRLPSSRRRRAIRSSISVPFVYMMKKQSECLSARSRTPFPPSRQTKGSPPLRTKNRLPHSS